MSIVSEARIGSMHVERLHQEMFSWNNDCTQIAYVAKSGGLFSKRYNVIHNDSEGPTLHEVRYLRFSPDGKRLVYAAKNENEEWKMHIGQDVYGPYEDLGAPVFSPNGDRYAFPAKTHRHWIMVTNDGQSSEYDEVADPIYSNDGKRFAYKSRSGKRWRLVVNGQSSTDYDNIFQVLFCSCGQHIAYVVEKKMLIGWPKTQVILNEKTGKAHTELSDEVIDYVQRPGILGAFLPPTAATKAVITSRRSLTFSSEGCHLAYVVQTPEERSFIVIDGQEQEPYNFCSPPVLSLDGDHLAYAARPFKGNAWAVVIDGKPHYALMAFDDPTLEDGALVDNINLVRGITTEKKGTLFNDILFGTPVFSPDGNRVAFGFALFADETQPGWRMCLDGRATIPHVVLGSQGPIFSPDSKHLAYMAFSDVSRSGRSKCSVNLDFDQGRLYSQIGTVTFSPDSSRLAYWAEPISKTGKVVVIVGDNESKEYDGIFPSSGQSGQLRFLDDKRILYLARDGNSLYRIEQSCI